MASNLYTVLSGLSVALGLEKDTRKAEVKYLSSVLSSAFQPALADGDTSGLVYGGADVTISAGQITVNAAGKVKNKFTVFGQEFDGSTSATVTATDHSLSIFGETFDGSADVSITNGTNIEVSSGKISVTSAAIAENATGVAIAGDVYTEIKNATNDTNAGLEALSGALEGYTSGKAVSSEFTTVKSNISTLSTDLGTVSSDLDTLSSEVSGAYGDGAKVIVSKTGGITKSNYTINGTADLTNDAEVIPSQKVVSAFVQSKITDLNLDSALTGAVATGEAITLAVSEQKVSADVLYDDATIKLTSDNKLSATFYLESAQGTENVATVYTLKDASGASHGTINIPKDQFLTSAYYDAATEKIMLQFNVSGDPEPSTTEIPVADLVHEYSAGNGIYVGSNDSGNNSLISAVINKSANDGKFLTLDANGIGLSGITDAINAASEDATTGLTTLSAALSSYLSGNAVANEFTAVDGRLDDLETKTTGTITSGHVVVGDKDGNYVDGGATLGTTAQDVTADNTAESATVMASEKTVEDSLIGLIGAGTAAELNTFAHGDANTVGALAKLQKDVAALANEPFDAVPTV